jgi:hypothetical protein
MMIGTRKEGSKLSGSVKSARIDSGFALPSLAAVATTSGMSTRPQTFQANNTRQGAAPV